MPSDVKVTCINKSDRQSPHERIRNIGGINADGTRWKLTEGAAINGVEQGKWRFYTSVAGKSVWVVIASSQSGQRYLKTESDAYIPNNLLSLPECP